MKYILLTINLLLCFLMFLPYTSQAQGKNIKVANITFEGISAFLDDRIRQLIITKKSSFLHKSYFNRQVFEDDIEAIEIFYHDQGYLDAEVRKYETHIDEDSSSVNITIYINEGVPTKVLKVEFSGNEAVSKEEFSNQVSVAPGDNFRNGAIDESSVSILTYYRTKGFSEAEVEPTATIDHENKQVSVLFNIKENSLFIIEEIRINGFEKTRINIINREIGFKSGDTINSSMLLESQRKIYETGLFRSVYIHPTETASGREGKKDVIVELHEKDSIRMSVSAGYDTEEEFRGKVEAYTINLMGMGKKLGASGRISFIRKKLSGSFTSPRLFATQWHMDINTGWDYLDEPSYNLRRIFGLMSIGRNIGNYTFFRIQYRQDHSKAENITLLTIPDKTANDISSIELSLRHDRRNNLFNATKGIYWEITTELGDYLSGKTASFLHSNGRIKYYYPLHRFTILATSLELGVINTARGFLEIPLQERFYSGGGRSIRGYEYNMVGPLDANGKPLGGKIKIIWNIFEVRRKIYKILDGVVFCDAGNVWKNSGTFDITDIRTSSGLGLRLNTPVGVIRVDYGFRLNRSKDDPRGKIYFNMGQAF
ncbi:MAG: outer membrane protein assembly factor BamA [Deltaproteobacteria bacterium]|nr:outer membrane protein assembly factor BamA [Deltaproteobacteria bacterium]